MKTNLQTIESLLREIIKCVEEGGSEEEILERLEALEETVQEIQESMYEGIPVTEQSSSSATISPNEWNVWTSPVSNLTITKGTDVEDIVNEYMIKFTIDSSATSPQAVFNGWQLNWNGGSVPTWTAGHTYEISIINNIALWADIETTP